MPTCPRGHATAATDWCDVCGRSMTAAPSPAASTEALTRLDAPPRRDAPSQLDGPPPREAPPQPEGCPLCRTPRAGRFCEVDGYDFMTATVLDEPDPVSTGTRTSGPTPAQAAATAAAAVDQVPAANAAAVTVSADRAYFDLVRAAGGPDADALVFPDSSPERKYPLHGTQMLVGRRSRSRGIVPDIDLGGPPADPGISHAHALLIPQPDGSWAVVDLGSANGTYVNDTAKPVPARAPVPIRPGDRVYAGAWTLLTVT